MFHLFEDEDGDFSVAYIPEGVIMMLLLEEMFQKMRRRRQFYTPPTDTFTKGWSKKELTGSHSTPTTLRSPISATVAPHFNQNNDGCHADLVICAKGETPLYAHKVILGSWSNRLREMILREELKRFPSQSPKKGECVSRNLLRIETVEAKDCAVAFKDFIQFMYTETITLSLQSVWAHVMLAIKYNVKELFVTCGGFIFKRVSEMTIGSTMKEVMVSARNHHGSKGVVQVTMQRIITELFLHEDDTVMYLNVDLLCDVLRSSSVVAISEFDIFQKLKPKLDALKEAGEHRQVLRLLSLLRLTQMTSSELREVVSSEYMDEMRRAFSGKFETALWIRALYSEQRWQEVPINIEQTRLYLENPIANTDGSVHNSVVMSAGRQDKVQPLIKLGDIVLTVREGQQRVTVNKHNHHRATLEFPVYKVSTGHHGVVKHSTGWTLELPPGKFPAVTVYIVRPRREEIVNLKIVLALYKTTRGQSDPKPTVICYEGKDFTGLRKECTIDSMPITEEEMEVSVRVVGYAYGRGRARFHHVVNPVRWLSCPPAPKHEEPPGARAKVGTSGHEKSNKKGKIWVKNSKKKRKRKRKDCWW